MPISNPLKKYHESLHEESERGEKVHNLYTFMLIGNFFYELNFYQPIWNHHRILRFFIPIMHTKRPKITKNLFFKHESELTIFFNSGFGATRC